MIASGNDNLEMRQRREKGTNKLSSELATVKFSVSHPTKDVDDRVDWIDASG